MKLRPWTLPALFSLIAFLLVVTTWLWEKNRCYGQQNRVLILQNDSLQSVNIRLSEEIERKKQWAATAKVRAGSRK